MISRIKLDGIYTEEFGVEVQERYEIPTPERDIETIEIRGRHGSLTKKYGYKDIQISIGFSINKRWENTTFKAAFRKIKQMFLNAKTLEVDDDPEIFYKIKSVSIENAENRIVEFGQFTVDFVLDPFQYEIADSTQIITSRTILNNEGYESEPIITVTCNGTGKVYVNEQEITIQNINGTITIDSEMKNAYRITNGYVTNLNNHMIGDFPILEHGENVIDFDGDIESLKINPRWRWV